MDSLRTEVVAIARSYINTPWQHRGRTPGAALDCAGVLVCAARAKYLVSEFFDVPEYSRNPDGKTLIAWLEEYMGGRVPKSALQIGDVVVVRPDRYPQHLGIVSDHISGCLGLIHASNARSTVPARVIETRLMFSRALAFVAGYRFPGISS